MPILIVDDSKAMRDAALEAGALFVLPKASTPDAVRAVLGAVAR